MIHYLCMFWNDHHNRSVSHPSPYIATKKCFSLWWKPLRSVHLAAFKYSMQCCWPQSLYCNLGVFKARTSTRRKLLENPEREQCVWERVWRPSPGKWCPFYSHSWKPQGHSLTLCPPRAPPAVTRCLAIWASLRVGMQAWPGPFSCCLRGLLTSGSHSYWFHLFLNEILPPLADRTLPPRDILLASWIFFLIS